MMLDPRFELTVPKFSMCTGSGPKRKKIDGKRNCCLSNMKCNGQQSHFCTRPDNGRIGLKSQMSIRDQRHMLLGSHLNGEVLRRKLIGYSDQPIWSIPRSHDVCSLK